MHLANINNLSNHITVSTSRVLQKSVMQVVGVAACNVQLHLALKLTHLCSAISTLYFLIPLDVVAILYNHRTLHIIPH